MPRTVRTKVYKFEELTAEAKQTAIDSLSDINVSENWLESTYEDAANIGLKIKAFDIDRGECKGKFEWDGRKTASEIILQHGENCETYKTAQTFLEYIKRIEAATPVIFEEGTENEYEDHSEREALIEEAEEEFLKSLCEDYRIILRNDYEYLTSKAAIIETIEANDYEFYQSGKLYN